MDKNPNTEIPAKCSPAFSIAGVMPAASEMAWKTSYPNPDADHAAPRPAGHGPTFSVAGVIPGAADAGWRTACPDPTRDVLDAYGHVISKVEAQARAELQRGRKVRALPTARTERRAA